MKLTIIIPVYNGAEFISKSYNSILTQDDDDFEILYVNNNSTDNSVVLIKEIMRSDDRVRLINQPIQGEAYARNLGIKEAKGKFIYQLDVDDEIYPMALNKMLNVLELNPDIEAVFGKMVKSLDTIADSEKPTDETDTVKIYNPPKMGLKWFKSLKHVVGPPGFMYRKRVFEKIGSYNGELVIGTDTAMDVRLGILCKVAFIDTYIYLYFKHRTSSLNKVKKDGELIFHTWTRMVKEHLPFSFSNKVPEEFKIILFKQILSMMGKLVYYSPSYKHREAIIGQIKQDIKPLKIPTFIIIFLWLLVAFPLETLLKIYVYHFSPKFLNSIMAQAESIKGNSRSEP